MLVLAACIQTEAPELRAACRPVHRIEARFVRSAVVIRNRLPQVEAVPQRQPANALEARIQLLAAIRQLPTTRRHVFITAYLALQRGNNLPRLRVPRDVFFIIDLIQHPFDAATGPRPHAQECSIGVSQRMQSCHRRVYPTVHRHIDVRRSRRAADLAGWTRCECRTFKSELPGKASHQQCTGNRRNPLRGLQ